MVCTFVSTNKGKIGVVTVLSRPSDRVTRGSKNGAPGRDEVVAK